MLAKGDKIGRYVVVEELGHGGTGDVYRARDDKLRRDVAVKVLRAADDVTPDVRVAQNAFLLREAQAAVAFKHRNVVEIHDAEETPDGLAYIAMELVHGVTLRRFVGEDAVPLAQRMQWLADVAQVLRAAHDRGLIHRDVKPENVMIDKDGAVKVLDFGLARRVDADPTLSTTALQLISTISTQGGATARVAGTPPYMAPEQMRGEPIDGCADQFSWGVMAYELLSGRMPWGDARDQLRLLANLMSTEPQPLVECDGRIPERVSRAVQRAMAKLPGQRFPSMAGVLEALEGSAQAVESTAPANPTAMADASTAMMEDAHTTTMGDARSVVGRANSAMQDANTATVNDARTQPGESGHTDRVRRAWTHVAIAVAAVALLAMGAVIAGRCIGGPTPPRADHIVSPRAPLCLSHAACTAASGQASRCFPDVGCVALVADGCQLLAEPSDLADDRTVFFGAIMPLGKDGGASSDLHALDLARRDFATMMKGFRENGTYGQIRGLALVACDEARGVERGVHHLVNEVRVPAIIGFSNGQKLIDLAGATLGPHGVLVIAPFTTSPLLSTLPRVPGQPRMVYRTTYNSLQTARALALAVPAFLEPELRAGSRVVDRTHRVALVRQRATRLQAFADQFFTTLRFNGKRALDNGANYRELTYDDTNPASPTAGYAVVRDALLAFAPHVVVYVGDDQMIEDVVLGTERFWKVATYRPRWLAISFIADKVLHFVDNDPVRRRRFFGISEATNRGPNARFVLHYNDVFPDKIDRAGGPNSSYDAFYVAAYATYALDDNAPVTGIALAGAMRRLIPPGRLIDVGPRNIFEAFSALRRGENIDLNGAAGSLDFDLDTGDAVIDQTLLCISVDAQGRASGSMEAGVIYDARSTTLHGTSRCP